MARVDRRDQDHSDTSSLSVILPVLARASLVTLTSAVTLQKCSLVPSSVDQGCKRHRQNFFIANSINTEDLGYQSPNILL